MVSYTQNELLSITDFTKSISKVLNSIKDNSIEKIGVLKNNKLEAVVISTDEYERLKKLDELIEEQEDKELLKIIKDRTSRPFKTISQDELLERLNISKDSIK